jgi:hypothetical protein
VLLKKTSKANPGVIQGFRSGLEEKVAAELTLAGVGFLYEKVKIPYEKPATPSKYTPDFIILSNGIIAETKGRFLTDDRKKHLLVREQNPDLDIRFVFSNSKTKIGKQSPTTYANWCQGKNQKKMTFKYADKSIPQAWLDEAPNVASMRAIEVLTKGTTK